MITVWFFLAYVLNGTISGGAGLTQVGPFMTHEECENASTIWSAGRPARYSSKCYQGVWGAR